MQVLNRLTGIRAAIVDLDGTMLDTADDFHVAINRMRADMDLAPLERDRIMDFVGQGSENLVHRVLAIGLPPEDAAARFDDALASYLGHYLAINGDHTMLYPGVMEGLSALHAKGLRLACVTNKPFALAVPLLEKMALRDWFEVVYGGDSLPAKKPDPLPMLRVCADFGLPPSKVVAIGDSSNDAKAARAAGCKVLTVPYGYNHGQPVQGIDSDGIVPSLLDAAALIFV
jgi:phosphoglycolate phosphatase